MPGSSEKTILVVEDDNRVSEAVCKYLTKHGFSCVPLHEGKKALSYLSRVNLVLLDLNLPDADGLEVLQELRRKSSLPVMIMSARGEGHQRILGLELGADDYVVKPVLPGELLARVKALFRRGRMHETEAEELVFDEKARMVRGAGVEISLTEQEFELLRFLSESPGQTFTREELLNLVWRDEAGERTRRVDLTISRIRTKFADQQLEPPIESVWKVGYRFKSDEAG